MASSALDSLPPAARAQFALLQQRFVAGLASRRQEFSGGHVPQQMAAAAHRLAGAAGGYGFDALSACARDLERQCALADQPDLSRALALLHQEIDRITAQAG